MLRRSGRGCAALALIAGAMALSGFPGSHAQGADLTRATCADLNRLPSGERRQIGLWLHGYYTGAAQRPFLDMASANAAIAAMLAACGEEPERLLLGLEMGALLRGTAPAGLPRSQGHRADGHIVIEQESPAEAAPAPIVTRPRPLD